MSLTTSVNIGCISLVIMALLACSPDTDFRPREVSPGVDGLNVLDYGCNPDGADDCSKALTNALAEAASEGVSTVYFPSGEYLLSSSVRIVATSACHMKIKGAGPGLTRLVTGSTKGGLSIEFQDENSSIEVEDITFIAGIPMAGIGLYVKRPITGRYTHRSASLLNVEFRVAQSEIASDKCFATGVMLRGAYRPRFENVVVAGPYGPNVEDTPQSVMYKANCGISLEECFAPEFEDTYVWSQQKAIVIDDMPSLGNDPVSLLRCNMVNCLSGLTVTSSKTSPVVVEQCHSNCKDFGLHLKNCHDVSVRGSLLYNGDELEHNLWPAYSDICLEKCSDVLIQDNIFHMTCNLNRTGVDVRNSNGVKVIRNVFTFTGLSMKSEGNCSSLEFSGNSLEPTAKPPQI